MLKCKNTPATRCFYMLVASWFLLPVIPGVSAAPTTADPTILLSSFKMTTMDCVICQSYFFDVVPAISE